VSDSVEQRVDGHDREWRDPMAVIAQWSDAGAADAALLRTSARGGWWEALAAAGVALVVSREYEHLVLAISPVKRRLSYIRLPHPSGIAFDAARERLYVASTRNPNQIFEFGRVAGALPRRDVTRGAAPFAGRLVPLRSWYLPGCAYLHDLAMIGGRLHANSVGTNTVVELAEDGAKAVWWPSSIERDGVAMTDRNYIQLNSIAAGADLTSSFFSASGERPGRYRPGHVKHPVDGRGVVYSGATREPIVRGLTRPHSARLHGGRVWVDDSGYGAVGVVADGRFERVARLPGWTRGLAFAGGIAFVGTSRVIPRFAHYAPGVDLARSRCAIHAVDAASGAVLGSLEFPSGNQIFAIEPIPAGWIEGFPFNGNTRPHAARALFYAYDVER
jgi:uncharacterized protein (TIGR03032 family)